MTQPLYQQFRLADTIQKVSVKTIDLPETGGTSLYFLSLKDVQDTFPSARYFKLNGHLIPFLSDHDGTRPQCIVFHPAEILDVFSEEPQSNKTSAAHCSNIEGMENQSSHNSLLSSSSPIPSVAHGVKQIALIKPRNEDTQHRILRLLLEAKAEAKEKNDKMMALQDKILAQQGKILALQQEAEEKQNKMLALQLDANAKDDKILTLQGEMLQIQQQALDRLALIHKQGAAILTQTYELHEYPTPRLFIVLPKNSSKLNPSSYINNEFRLYFFCECGEHTKKFSGDDINISHHIHLAKHEGYDLQRPKDFMQKYGRYMLILLEMIKYGVMFAGIGVPVLATVKAPAIIDMVKGPLKVVTQTDINDSIEYLQGLVGNDSKGQVDPSTSLDALEGADLRHLEEFIKDKDKHRVLGNLYRIVTQEGHVKWVCIDHYDLSYNEQEQLAFKNAVDANGGSYQPQLGRVTVRLGSKIRAEELFDTLAKARRVHDLDITFDWECGSSNLESLGDVLHKSRVSILRLDLRLFRKSRGSKLLPKFTQYEALLRIMDLPSLRIIHIVLPKKLVKIFSFQPKKLSPLCKLSLEIAPSTFGEKEIRVSAEALKTNWTITTLKLQNSWITTDGVQALFDALKINSTLITLDLEGNSIGDNGAQALSEALKINLTLTTLNLNYNSIGFEGTLALLLAQRLDSTLTINLDNNPIKESTVQALSEALKINSTLTTLSLGFNAIGANGAQMLSEVLKVNLTLTALNLGTNSIGNSGAQALSEALKINLILTNLDLGSNSIGVSGAQALSEALKINSTLTTLNLNYNSIGDDGAQALSEALKINSSLTTLNLNYNSIGVNGAQALSEALKINSTLITLGLRDNFTGYDGAQALSEALRINSILTTLDLSRNSIGNDGARALSEALKINSTLHTLDLSYNSIGFNAAQALSKVLRINSTLTTLNLQFNSFDNSGAQVPSVNVYQHPRMRMPRAYYAIVEGKDVHINAEIPRSP
ncbi:hypothetical protein BGZ98_008602 [Dissophora globulifera]|nr:hypothetical protein BGZ98_008602 [Dissophora globulifera]